MTYDFFAQEWHGKCGACNTALFAPTKGAYLVQFALHTHSKVCIGGW